MLFAPAILRDGFGMAGADHHHHFALGVEHVLAQGRHGVGDGERQIEGVLAGLVVDVVRRLAAEHRDRALLTLEAALDMQRIPGALLLVLGDAVGVLAGMPERCLVGHAGNRLADVGEDQLDRAADGGVGAVALAEHVRAAVHAKGQARRAVHHQQRRRQMGRALHAVEIERGIGHRLDRRDDHRHVFRQAARHHAIDRDLLDRRLAPARRNLRHQSRRGELGAGQHGRHPLLGGRNHRQAVGPALVVAELERVHRLRK